jgi:hypothetical protein
MVVAHAGHWFASLAYAAPVIVLMGWLGVVKVKEAKRRRRGEPSMDDSIQPTSD